MFTKKKVIGGLLFVLFVFSNSFATVSQNAGKLLITEVAIKETNDWIELYVVDGSVDWSEYRLRIGSSYNVSIPAEWNLQSGDYIIVHSENGTNDTNKSDNNVNYWDIYGMGNLTNTDKIIQIIEPSGSTKKVDCFIYSNNDGGFSGGASDANSAVDDGMWDNYNFTTGDAGAWTDTDDVGQGQTIARYLNASHTTYIDNNSKTDWYLCTTPSQGSANDQSLPVFLNSFSASVSKNGVLLRWQTESEVNNAGFYICRSENKNGDFDRISPLIRGAGNTNRIQKYEFIDHNVLAGKTYYYLIEDLDINGAITKHNVVSITFQPHRQENFTPKSFRISPSYPNPFGAPSGNLSTSVQLTISKNGSQNAFSISIFNLLGQKVYRFSANKFQPGEYVFNWPGIDDTGNQLGNGTYFWVIQSDKIYEVRRVTLLR